MTILDSKTTLETLFTNSLSLAGIVWDWASANPNPNETLVGRVDLIQVENSPGVKGYTFSVSVGVWSESIQDLQQAQYGMVDSALAAFDPMIPVCSSGLSVTLGSIQLGLPNKSAQNAGYSNFRGVWAITLFEVNLQG